MTAAYNVFGDPPWLSSTSGFQADFGVYAPPGARVFYLCNGTRTGDDPDFTKRLVGGSSGTLAQAMSLCRAGMNDVIMVLPGHAENVTDATMMTNLVNGTRIVGIVDPRRDDAPTFTWTATGASWAVTQKNVRFQGLRLLMDQANGVTAPINITGAQNMLVGNYMRWSVDGTHKATTAITVGSGALDTQIVGNTIRGAAAGVCTDGIKLLGATTPDGTVIAWNRMHAAATSATGLVNVTVAALNLYIGFNTIENLTASSIAGITFGAVACDGSCEYNNITVKSTGAHTSGTTGLHIGAGCLVGFHQNFSVNDPAASGLLMPTVDT